MLDPYDCLLRPVVTEKSMLNTSAGAYTFVVSPSSTKSDVKLAVETVFSVKVSAVRLLNRVGKIRVFKGKHGKRPDSKRAIVRLKEGAISFENGF